jgi:hypothetical protein
LAEEGVRFALERDVQVEHRVPGGEGAALLSPPNHHTTSRPAGVAGRFWGYYREERSPSSRSTEPKAACRAKLVPAESGCNRPDRCLTVARVRHQLRSALKPLTPWLPLWL